MVGHFLGTAKATETPVSEARSRVHHSHSFLFRRMVVSNISGKNVTRVVNSAKICVLVGGQGWECAPWARVSPSCSAGSHWDVRTPGAAKRQLRSPGEHTQVSKAPAWSSSAPCQSHSCVLLLFQCTKLGRCHGNSLIIHRLYTEGVWPGKTTDLKHRAALRDTHSLCAILGRAERGQETPSAFPQQHFPSTVHATWLTPTHITCIASFQAPPFWSLGYLL